MEQLHTCKGMQKGCCDLIFTKYEEVHRLLILHFSENVVMGVNFKPNR